jgi:glycosyltransferase involved in cell wall biosynthesis
MAKRVLIDGRNLALEQGTGVATYSRNLSKALSQIGFKVDILYGSHNTAHRSNLLKEITFFDPYQQKGGRVMQYINQIKRTLASTVRRSCHTVPISGTVILEGLANTLPHFDTIINSPHLFATKSIQQIFFRVIDPINVPNRPSIAHWTYPLPFEIKGVPNIYTLHDLVPLRLPYTTLDRKSSYFKLVSTIARTANHIVTVSESSKNDIVNLLGVSPDKVTNTYQSVSLPAQLLARSEESIASEVSRIFNLKYKSYYIFWGAIEPKKNVRRIIESFLDSGVDSKLVIVGKKAWKSEQELKHFHANEYYLGDKITMIDYLPSPLLISLIRGARCTIFPSIYEGFGLPVLESMLLGTPVISSNTSSIPEIAGDAAILVNPYSVQEISSAIKMVDHDENLRDSLASKGKKQALKFSPDEYENRLKDLYEKVLP